MVSKEVPVPCEKVDDLIPHPPHSWWCPVWTGEEWDEYESWCEGY